MTDKYQGKLVTPAEAVKLVQDGDRVSYGFAYTHPHLLDETLAARISEGGVKGLEFTGILPLSNYAVYDAAKTMEQAKFTSPYFSGISRKMYNNGNTWFIPMLFSESAGYWENIRPCNVLMIQVAPMDDEGYFNLGPCISDTWGYAKSARNIILEENTSMPVAHGVNNKIHISEVDAVIQGNNPPLEEIPTAPENPIDLAIAKHIVNRIGNGSTLQFGIGSVPTCTGNLIAESDLQNLHCHTEMMTEAYVSIFNAGKLTGLEQGLEGKAAYTFAGGTKALYDLIDDNPFFAAAPVDYINDPFVIASIDKFVSINSFLEIDMLGQVCSESVGPKQISGTGGQLDFVMGAYKSKGGQSFLCAPSTRTLRDGTVKSAIVPTLPTGSVVTVPRPAVHMVVTEYGIAELKGRSTWERTEALINVAHPDFQDQLVKDAEKMGIWTNTSKCTF